MPEIAEVARVVHQIRKRLVGKTVRAVVAKDDANIFGKVGTTAAEFQKVMMGKRIVDAGQQGKYFWLAMSSPPHPLLHLGMSGWLHIKGETKLHFKSKATSNKEVLNEGEKLEEWPPKYWKFTLETSDSDTGSKRRSIDNDSSIVEVAFTDPRRFGRVRLLDCAMEDIRKVSPLKENGPDPIIDKNILSLNWLQSKLCNKHVPIKTFLLDQANISGIGNWVGDEILYNAKIHPEQYSDTLSAQQMKVLYDCLMYICETAVGVLADSEKFPSHWLFNYRWGKAKLTRTAKKRVKGDEDGEDTVSCLPNGAKIAFITVGGRTSCIVPSVQQKKAALIKSDNDEEENENRSGNRATRSQIKTEDKILESNETKVTFSRKRKNNNLHAPLLLGNTRKSPRFHST